MREIKFRAWLKEQKKMVHPRGELTVYFTEYPASGCEFENVEEMALATSTLKSGGQRYDDWCRCGFEQDEIELMQYTGLKDKNGKEIYEGDIVKVCSDIFGKVECYDRPEVVKWDEELAGFQPFIECSGQIEITYVNSTKPEHLEVIGNIHENPKLLEAK